MYLSRLIYCSQIQLAEAGIIQDILSQSQKNNNKYGITGILIFNNNYFLQCLEGPRTAVNDIYIAIVNDNRHSHPLLLDYRAIDSRDFADWDMGYLGWNESLRKIVKMYSSSGDFDPYTMSGESAHQFLRALRGVLSTQHPE